MKKLILAAVFLVPGFVFAQSQGYVALQAELDSVFETQTKEELDSSLPIIIEKYQQDINARYQSVISRTLDVLAAANLENADLKEGTEVALPILSLVQEGSVPNLDQIEAVSIQNVLVERRKQLLDAAMRLRVLLAKL